VGVHPFASQASRQWLPTRWRELITRLQARGHRVLAFGAPSERGALLALVDGLLSADAAVTVPMDDFFEAVGRLDLLVGLDSFSVHAAQSRGVPTVMIAGSNDHRLWQTPRGEVAWSTGGCPHHPCYNKPKCLETVSPYSCIRSVEVQQVFAHVEELLRRAGHSAPARDARIA
jgi:heptosyltransferase-3